ncbi:MAG: tetratricopeptide repeat protein [Leptolyngbyaceae cyanobacterium]
MPPSWSRFSLALLLGLAAAVLPAVLDSARACDQAICGASQYQAATPIEMIWEPPSELAQTDHADIDRANQLSDRVVDLFHAGRYSEAVSVAEEVVALFRQHLEGTHPDLLISINNLAVLYQALGRYDEAEPLLQEALSIRQQQLDPDNPELATSLNNLAAVYQFQGRQASALPLFEQAIAILQQQPEPDLRNLAATQNNLATAYEALGRYDEAAPLYQEALTILEDHLGPNHPDVATALHNLASFERLQGRYVDAEAQLQRVLQIREAQQGRSHPEFASALNELALIYRNQGRYDEAEPLLNEALDTWREQLGNDHPNVATALNNLARLYRAQRRYDEAASSYQEALALWRQQLGDNHPSVATALNNLAALYSLQPSRQAEAETLLAEALAIRRAQLGPTHPDVANSLSNLATLFAYQGDYGAAEDSYDEVLAIRQQRLGPEHPDVALTLGNLASVYWPQQRYPETIRTLASALEIEERNLIDNLTALSDEQQQAYLNTIATTLHMALSLSVQTLPDSVDAAELALETVLRRKGRSLDITARSHQVLRQRLAPAEQQQFDQLVETRRQIATLRYGELPGQDPDQYQRKLVQLQNTEKDLQANLSQRSVLFRTETTPVTLEAVQAAIPEGAALVELMRYRPVIPNAPVLENFGPPRYALYGLDGDGLVAWRDLGDAATIDLAVDDFNRALVNRGQSPTDASRTLTTLILDPILPALAGKQRLLIAPDGQLNRIPFEALRTADDRYLIEQFEITTLTSGRDLLRLQSQVDSRQPPLLLANPDYEQAGAATSTSTHDEQRGQRAAELARLQFGPLPGTAAEGTAIAALLPEVTLLTGADATENVLKQVQGPQILHIATHGFFLGDLPAVPPINTRGLGVVSATDLPPEAPLENPLLRSGLALAGFNQRASGEEDGALTALEAAGLDLYGTQLVVLSACETGVGEVITGEGVYGLRRAMTIAGAETLVLSLWQVDDIATQEAMTAYYEYLLAGSGRAESLRQVQLEMIDSNSRYAHPYYWAAFITTGDWRPLE